MSQPNYPHIILTFFHRGYRVEIDQDTFNGQNIYSVWVTHNFGSAVAVPCCYSKAEAIRKGKKWIEQKINDNELGVNA